MRSMVKFVGWKSYLLFGVLLSELVLGGTPTNPVTNLKKGELKVTRYDLGDPESANDASVERSHSGSISYENQGPQSREETREEYEEQWHRIYKLGVKRRRRTISDSFGNSHINPDMNEWETIHNASTKHDSLFSRSASISSVPGTTNHNNFTDKEPKKEEISITVTEPIEEEGPPPPPTKKLRYDDSFGSLGRSTRQKRTTQRRKRKSSHKRLSTSGSSLRLSGGITEDGEDAMDTSS